MLNTKLDSKQLQLVRITFYFSVVQIFLLLYALFSLFVFSTSLTHTVLFSVRVSWLFLPWYVLFLNLKISYYPSIHQFYCIMIDFFLVDTFFFVRSISLFYKKEKNAFHIRKVPHCNMELQKNCVAKQVLLYEMKWNVKKAAQRLSLSHISYLSRVLCTEWTRSVFLSVWDANLYIICNCTHRIWNQRHLV